VGDYGWTECLRQIITIEKAYERVRRIFKTPLPGEAHE
jgi:hypothetical protein